MSMMPSELSSQARTLLDAAREGLGPDAAMLSRVRGKIDAAIGGGGATISSGMSIGAKLSIFSVIALVIGGAILLRGAGGDDDAMTSPALELAAPSVVEAPVRRAHDEPPPATPHLEMPVEAAPRQMPASTPAALAPVHPAPQIEAAVPGVDLAREVQLVDAAMASLRDGNATAAIQSVRLHRAETGDHGQLAEDAAAIEIEALCKLHDRKVVAKLEAFDARWADSAQRSRLSTNCF
jgi:hypothetical protein